MPFNNRELNSVRVRLCSKDKDRACGSGDILADK